MTAKPAPQSWDGRAYRALRRLRDLLLAPLALPLAALRVPPAAVSLVGPALASTTVWTLAAKPRLALAALLGALLADAVDGAVARRRGRESPRGKLLDQACDAATFTALVAAGLAAGRVGTGAAAYAVAGSALAVIFGMAREARRLGPAWWQNPRAGFAAHLPKAFYLLALPLFLAGGPDLLAPALFAGNAVATLTVLAWGIESGLRALRA